ncbi:MAG: GTPase, partial [Methylococcales bacterium]
MLDFVKLLKRGYQNILHHGAEGEPFKSHIRDCLGSLCLGEALLEKGELLKNHPNLPLQFAVIGPTQAGKSSVVNLLLGHDYAGVSPLAGFTTFPQGFALGLQDKDRAAIENFFHDYRRVNTTEDTKNRNGAYSFRQVPAQGHPAIERCILWDTPDFDSIHSQNYYNSLLRTIALADLILVVLSKDKYADQSVWSMLSLIEVLNQPTIVFLNKISPENTPVVVRSFMEKWRHHRKDPPPPIVAAPFSSAGIKPANAGREIGQLLVHLDRAKSAVKRNQHRQHCAVLLNRYWAKWTQAVREEQNLLSEWACLVDNAAKSSLEIYERHYLNHPQHYETLKQALAGLLTLLEIPGIAPLLMKIRALLTWPVRRLFGLGRMRTVDADNEQRKSREMQVLERMFEHGRIHLSDAVFSKRAQSRDHEYWWNEISSLLKSETPSLSEIYNQAVKNYQADFQVEIEAAAHRLYSKLEQQPATLNSLRATRITTDAAVLAVALKTGGIGVHDFVVTPAVLSLTSYLTESALGHYLNRVEAELKQKQLQAVTSKLFDEALNKELTSLPARMNPNNKFNIPE